MLGAVRRAAARGAAQAQKQAQRRAMSSGHSVEEEIKEMNKWRVITFIAVPVCIAKGAYDLTHIHHHHADAPGYSYMNIRSKDFPWGKESLFSRKGAAEH